jgi:hypothetical protein
MRCAGRSEKPSGPFSLEDLADDLSELLEALNLTGPVDVIGAALAENRHGKDGVAGCRRGRSAARRESAADRVKSRLSLPGGKAGALAYAT